MNGISNYNYYICVLVLIVPDVWLGTQVYFAKQCTKPNRQQLTNWGLNLRSLRYEIFPIRGEENYIADNGSRWGNRHADKEVKFNAVVGPRTVTKALMKRIRSGTARSKCVLRIPQPKVYSDVHTPDIDARKDLMLKMDTRGVNMQFIREHQDKYRKSRPKGLRVGKGKVWCRRTDLGVETSQTFKKCTLSTP